VNTASFDAANTRAQDANAACDKALGAQRTAETARDKAIAERATVELAPLTGLDAWQFTPVERDHVASLAASNPDAYRKMVDERTDKGVRAGAISRLESRGHLPTSKGDPTPRDVGGTSAPGMSLREQAERNLAQQDAQNAAAD
jgi:hypothetical protein